MKFHKPSKFSAIKINGKRAYDLARKNIDFEIKSRQIKIYSIKLIENNPKIGKFEITCSKGTYVRSLARDICKSMDVAGYVSKLTRLQVGIFSHKKTIPLDLLKLSITYMNNISDGSIFSLQDVIDKM